MDETTRAIIDSITVYYDPPKRLSDGRECAVFFDCSRLSPNDLSRLGAQAVGDLDENSFDAVVGIAYTGVLFAAAVAGGKGVTILQADGGLYGESVRGKRVLVADDVVFMRTRIEAAQKTLKEHGANVVAFVCVVDRSQHEAAAGETPLYSAFQARLA